MSTREKEDLKRFNVLATIGITVLAMSASFVAGMFLIEVPKEATGVLIFSLLLFLGTQLFLGLRTVQCIIHEQSLFDGASWVTLFYLIIQVIMSVMTQASSKKMTWPIFLACHFVVFAVFGIIFLVVRMLGRNDKRTRH